MRGRELLTCGAVLLSACAGTQEPNSGQSQSATAPLTTAAERFVYPDLESDEMMYIDWAGNVTVYELEGTAIINPRASGTVVMNVLSELRTFHEQVAQSQGDVAVNGALIAKGNGECTSVIMWEEGSVSYYPDTPEELFPVGLCSDRNLVEEIWDVIAKELEER